MASKARRLLLRKGKGLKHAAEPNLSLRGATRGIGKSMAMALAHAGADIVLVQRSQSSGTRDEIAALGVKCTIVECDLSDPKQTSALVEKVLTTVTPEIDILINCGGIQRRHNSEDFPDDDWNEVVQVNLTACFHLARGVGKHLLARGAPGRIINVASLMSFQGGIRIPAYAAAKGGILSMTKTLSNEWSGRNICVNAIAPGYISTDMNEALINDADRARSILERIPAHRWGKPADFEAAVLLLSSFAGAGYITGECVTVDGGWMGR